MTSVVGILGPNVTGKIFFLIEKSSIVLADKAEFKPSVEIKPVGHVEDSFNRPKPKKPHWLGGSNQFRNR